MRIIPISRNTIIRTILSVNHFRRASGSKSQRQNDLGAAAPEPLLTRTHHTERCRTKESPGRLQRSGEPVRSMQHDATTWSVSESLPIQALYSNRRLEGLGCLGDWDNDLVSSQPILNAAQSEALLNMQNDATDTRRESGRGLHAE